MLAHDSKELPALRQAIEELGRLRRFPGPPAEFWPAFMAAAGALARPRAGCSSYAIPPSPTV